MRGITRRLGRWSKVADFWPSPYQHDDRLSRMESLSRQGRENLRALGVPVEADGSVPDGWRVEFTQSGGQMRVRAWQHPRTRVPDAPKDAAASEWALQRLVILSDMTAERAAEEQAGGRLTGISSNAMSLYALGLAPWPQLGKFPGDAGDFYACQRARAGAPPSLHPRMDAVLAVYKARTAEEIARYGHVLTDAA